MDEWCGKIHWKFHSHLDKQREDQEKISNMRSRARNIHSSRWKITLGVIMLVFAAVKIQVNGTLSNYLETMVTFNTYLGSFGVNNKYTECISKRIEYFKGPMVKSDRPIEIFGAWRNTGIMIGTLAWKWMDDDGKEHQFLITEYLYVKVVNLRLMSPQH